jgi:hypothetical protein
MPAPRRKAEYTTESLERALTHHGVTFTRLADATAVASRTWLIETRIGCKAMTPADVYAYVIGRADGARRQEDDAADRSAVNAIATILTEHEDWSSETLDQVADVILTVRKQDETEESSLFKVTLR